MESPRTPLPEFVLRRQIRVVRIRITYTRVFMNFSEYLSLFYFDRVHRVARKLWPFRMRPNFVGFDVGGQTSCVQLGHAN